MTVFDKIFGRKKTADEVAKEMKRNIRKEMRNLDRSLRNIQVEQNKVKKSIKEAAKRGDTNTVKVLAKEMVQTKKAISKMYKTKAQLNSVELKVTEQLSQAKMMGSLKKSTDVMKIMNELMSVPEMSKTMREMSKEMQKAGMIEEMMDDVMEDVLDEDSDEVEEEEQNALNQVLDDVLGSELAANVVGKSELKSKQEELEEEDEEELSKRLNSLKN